MADINVERKRSGGPNFLPWLLGLLLLGALIWGLSRLLGGNDDVEPVPATDSTTLTTDTMMPTATPVTPMPADSAAMAPMPMDSGAVTGARDSAGGDNVPEGPKGNP
ncbi:MAG TPA: hypothetical protein VF613_21890 [Longimicrobium sp.]